MRANSWQMNPITSQMKHLILEESTLNSDNSSPTSFLLSNRQDITYWRMKNLEYRIPIKNGKSQLNRIFKNCFMVSEKLKDNESY